MKKSIVRAFLLGTLMFLICACAHDSNDGKNSENGGGSKESSGTAEVQVNIDDKVRACLNATNAFRTGNEAWYWNKDNTTKTDLTGKLGKLTLDENLCKAAQIRANEIVSEFSHTRPNGKDCFTVLKELSISYSAVGENIAAGRSTGEATFTQWKEDNEDYNGQGHRRNMLGKNFTRIGIAYTYDANSRYKYYWAMILAK